MKVVFFGTPLFAASLLEMLIENGVEIVAIITKPDKAQGRSGYLQFPPVKEIALSKAPEIPLFQPELVSAPEFASILQAFQADLFVVVAYGEIIKQHLLDMPPLGCINVHGSLLPKYRGAAPIQRAIMNGEKETGVTIMRMVRKMDAGDMIRKAVVSISPNVTYGNLERELCHAAEVPLLEVINEYARGQTPQYTPQDPDQVTFAPKIELEDCQIDWNKPAQEIHDLVRGVNPEPGAWCPVVFKGITKRLKVNKTILIDKNGAAGGLLQYDKKGIVVACGTSAVKILELQLEGKRCMNAVEFTCGVSAEQFRL